MKNGIDKIYDAKSEKKVEPIAKRTRSNTKSILDLPQELLAKILSFLPISDVGTIARANKTLNKAAEEPLLWSQKAIEKGIALNSDDSLPLKQKLRYFLEMSDIYPAKLVEFVGAKKLADLPNLELEDYDDYLRLSPETLKGNESMRGIDSAKRPFISLCIRNNISGEVQVNTIHQRFSERKDIWVAATGRSAELFVPPYGGYLTESSFEFVGRLFRHQPCGSRKDYRPELGGSPIEEKESRTTPDGKSVLELTKHR